jgi:HKD family nuclease
MVDFRAGLYDLPLTEARARALVRVVDDGLSAKLAGIDPADLPGRAAEVVAELVSTALNSVGSADRAAAAVLITRTLTDALAEVQARTDAGSGRLVDPPQRLVAVETRSPAGNPVALPQPLTPLRDTVLMTNGPDQPSIGREIAAEIESADGIDLVLAFIRWTGIRSILDPLRRHVEAGKRLRIITTTYTGSTELRALEALADIGAEVKVSYDTSTTRLHAKAWLFQRNTGFSTVYIGSSNLTHSAQVTGLEWNVRASQHVNADVVAGFERAFETYWADPHFEDFDAARFERATRQDRDDSILTPFAIEPYQFQRQMLERLRLEGGPRSS